MPQLTYLIIIKINGGRIRPDFFLNDPGKWRERNQQQRNIIDSTACGVCTCYWTRSNGKMWWQTMTEIRSRYYITVRWDGGWPTI